MSKKPVVLMVLDGYGLSDKTEGNAVALAKTCLLYTSFWIILSSGAEESLENSECICESQMIICCIPPFIIIAFHIIT